MPARRKFAAGLKSRLSKLTRHKAFLPFMATAGCGAYLMAAGVAGWAVWTLQDMPAMADLNTEKRPATVTYLDRHGREIGVRGSRGSRPVSLAMVADSLPVAVLAVEDRRYYNHPGIDPIGIARAIWVNKKRGRPGLFRLFGVWRRGSGGALFCKAGRGFNFGRKRHAGRAFKSAVKLLSGR